MASMTKAQLAAENATLRAEVSTLRAQVEAMRAPKHDEYESFNFRYPLTDSRGRAYRMDGRVKCYQP